MTDDKKNSTPKIDLLLDRKKDILNKATVLFFEKGYDNTTTRELAIAAGLSNAGIYYHFKDKEDILFNIIDGAVNSLLETVKSAVKTDNKPEENLRGLIEKILKLVLDYRMEIGLLIKESERLSTDQLNIIVKKRRDSYEIVKDEVARLKMEGKLQPLNISSVAFSLIAITNWPFHWYNPGGALTITELADEMSTIFFNGILK